MFFFRIIFGRKCHGTTVVQRPRSPNTQPTKDLSLGTNQQPCGRHHGVYLIETPMTTQLHQKTTYDDIKEALLAKKWNSFHLSKRKLDQLHLKDFLRLPIGPRPIDLTLKLDDGRLSLSLEILDYATFAPIMQLKMRRISFWNAPYITPS